MADAESMLPAPGLRRCPKCRTRKLAAEFSPGTPYCKKCQAACVKERRRAETPEERARRLGVMRAWQAANRDRRREYGKAYFEKVRRAVYAAYGGAACACCGEGEFAFLTLDHADGSGAAERRERGKTWAVIARLYKLNFPPGPYRVLCYNCNCGSHRNGGVCPHRGDRS